MVFGFSCKKRFGVLGFGLRLSLECSTGYRVLGLVSGAEGGAFCDCFGVLGLSSDCLTAYAVVLPTNPKQHKFQNSDPQTLTRPNRGTGPKVSQP